MAGQQKQIYLNLHYHGVNRYIFVNGVEIYNFKAKDSEVNAAPLCFVNMLKNCSVDKIQKTGLYEYKYNFSVDYDSFDAGNI